MTSNLMQIRIWAIGSISVFLPSSKLSWNTATIASYFVAPYTFHLYQNCSVGLSVPEQVFEINVFFLKYYE